uniref:Uncharacterized protein n=1 Tax=Panstrongylus megistus TaxID=65343 RepID=A0A069DUS4_9HEMI
MEKQQEATADSISTVGVPIKEYPPSEVYSSEPPPAYVRPKGNAVQIARIAALTLVAVSFILGFFMVASAYITASATCYQEYPVPPQEGAEDRPTYQHLVDPLDSEETADNKRESVLPPAGEHQDQLPEQPIQLKLPLQLDFDELAGSLIEKNQRSRMNCVVEKRRAEEVMDHQPKTVRLPFGVNLTTDPRYEHVTGERMAIFCESGNDQRHVPMEPQPQQPMMVPIAVHQIQVPVQMPQNVMPHHPNALPFHHGNGVPMQHANVLPIPQHPNAIPLQHSNAIPHHGLPIHPMHQPQHQPQHIPPQFLTHMPQKGHFLPAQQHNQRAQQMIPEEQQVIIQEEILSPLFQDFQDNNMVLETRDRVPEEHVMLPEGRVLMAEGRAMRHPQQPIVIAKELVHEVAPDVPSDTVKPPPPPQFHRLPIHVSVETQEQHIARQQAQQEAQPRPHFVQPRSVRSVDSVFDHHRDKRVRRCACDCAC